MIDLFRRARRSAGAQPSGLGTALVCVPAAGGEPVPDGCVGLVFDARGNIRRMPAGQRLPAGAGEQARLFHPGPYVLEVVPCTAAPEIGLRFELVVDSPDPRTTQQRFDLFVASEAPELMSAAMLQAVVETAVQRELSQERLFLPPCTSLDEWNRFRRGVNEVIYTRFGMIVNDCVPVDLGERVDFAALLAARAVAPIPQLGAVEWAQRTVQVLLPQGEVGRDQGAADARAMRRLFLELPCVLSGLRLALPHAQVPFSVQKALLARIDAACLAVDTMPAFALAAPSERLDPGALGRRAGASVSALEALDEAWGVLARLRSACTAGAAASDEVDRITANLEAALAARRQARSEDTDMVNA